MTRGFSPKPRISFGPALGLGIPSLGELMDVDLDHVDGVELVPSDVRDRLAAVCPPGIEIQDCTIVRLAGHPLAETADLGLGTLIDAVDVLIRPAPDGMAHDASRLARIAQAFVAKTSAPIVRTGHKGEKERQKTIDVRALVADVDVIADEASEKLCAALDWPTAPLLRVRVRSTAEGSAKPAEIARALGVWGSDDPRGTHAQIARLAMVARA